MATIDNWDDLEDCFRALPVDANRLGARCVFKVHVKRDGSLAILDTKFWSYTVSDDASPSGKSVPEVANEFSCLAKIAATLLGRSMPDVHHWLEYIVGNGINSFPHLIQGGDPPNIVQVSTFGLRGASLGAIRIRREELLKNADTSKPGDRISPKEGKFSSDDASWIEGKKLLSFKTVSLHTGTSETWLRKLGRKGALTVIGKGHRQKLTAESVREYFGLRKSEQI